MVFAWRSFFKLLCPNDRYDIKLPLKDLACGADCWDHLKQNRFHLYDLQAATFLCFSTAIAPIKGNGMHVVWTMLWCDFQVCLWSFHLLITKLFLSRSSRIIGFVKCLFTYLKIIFNNPLRYSAINILNVHQILAP